LARFDPDLDDDLLRDPRLLPFRLYTLLIYAVALRWAWRIGRVHVLPALRPIRRFRRIVFASPGDLSSLLRLLKGFSFTRATSRKVAGALGAYLLYLVFLFLALWPAFHAAEPDWQARVAKSFWHDSASLMVILQLMAVLLTLGLAYLMFAVSSFFLNRAKRQTAMTADSLRMVDKRAPVLYLRSFRNDYLPAEPGADRGISRFFDPYRERERLEAPRSVR
jgi:hypothetical protein